MRLSESWYLVDGITRHNLNPLVVTPWSTVRYEDGSYYLFYKGEVVEITDNAYHVEMWVRKHDEEDWAPYYRERYGVAAK